MSTPRDKDIEQLERQQERVGQEFGHVRWTGAEKQPDGSYREGVAAPLEPSRLTAEQFWNQQGTRIVHVGISPNSKECTIFQFAEAYAAAVSKNLQEELTKLKLTHAFAELHIAELEKEIAALRETK